MIPCSVLHPCPWQQQWHRAVGHRASPVAPSCSLGRSEQAKPVPVGRVTAWDGACFGTRSGMGQHGHGGCSGHSFGKGLPVHPRGWNSTARLQPALTAWRARSERSEGCFQHSSRLCAVHLSEAANPLRSPRSLALQSRTCTVGSDEHSLVRDGFETLQMRRMEAGGAG